MMPTYLSIQVALSGAIWRNSSVTLGSTHAVNLSSAKEIAFRYSVGHLDGLELTLETDAPQASTLLRQHLQIETLVIRLRRVLHELWLGEYGWKSIEVFAPIYDLICEMMALHGLAFARHNDEWRAVLCEDDDTTHGVQGTLVDWIKRADNSED